MEIFFATTDIGSRFEGVCVDVPLLSLDYHLVFFLRNGILEACRHQFHHLIQQQMALLGHSEDRHCLGNH